MNKYIYPEADEWMWDYCVYLGPYEDSRGIKYDLGVYKSPAGDLSAAIVYANLPGSYFSGDITFASEMYEEAFKRAKLAGL